MEFHSAFRQAAFYLMDQERDMEVVSQAGTVAEGRKKRAGEEPLRFLEMFKSDRFAEVSLNQVMALTPPEFVQEHLQEVDQELMGALYKEKRPVVE